MSSETWLKRILGSKAKQQTSNTEAKETKVRERLKAIVYDEELVDELLPTFMALQSVEGFNKVVELLETKEQQIDAMSGVDWFKQETTPKDQQTEDDADEESDDLVDAILKSKYEEN